MKKHIVISGKVQGVGFRYWLYNAATQRNIDGWVKNKITGEVEALLIGNDADINNLIKLCEVASTEDLFIKPKHGYTKELLNLMPKIESIYN